jgi:hypothetical protein
MIIHANVIANYEIPVDSFDMKNIFLIIIGLICSLTSYSQDKLWQVDKELTEYFSDTLYNQLDLHYSNLSDSTLVLWIEKYDVQSLSDTKKIRNHFFERKGDWSLIQMIWDGNVASFTPGLFDAFMKFVKPKGQFTISILNKGKISQDMVSFFEKHIVIVKAGEIKGLQIDSSTDMFNFKTNSVIILAEWLK